MKKFSLKNELEKIQLVALRFPFTLFFLIGLAILLFIQINKHDAHIQSRMWSFFSLGIGLSLSASLFLERFKNPLIKIGFNFFGLILLMIYCYLLPEKFEAVIFFKLISIGIVFILSAFVVSFLKKNNDISFWEFSKTSIIQLIITSVFAQVLMAGLSLAILSLNFLFKINVHQEVYQNLAVICFALFGPIYFLSNITPKGDMLKEEFIFNKFLKVLGLYILVPILVLYTLILYVYLAQIIVKWELPNGWVSTLVSVLGLGGFLAMLILFPLRLEKENKVVNFLSVYFPVILIPLLVLMSVGIFRRLGDYGFTINRLYVLILNVWLYGISIYLFISKSNHLKWIVISFSSVLLLSSVGPWSVYNVTKRMLIKEVCELLNEAKLMKDEKVIDNTTKKIRIDNKIAKSLEEKIFYLHQNYGNQLLQPFFKDSIENISPMKIKEKLGIDTETLNALKSRYFDFNISNRNLETDLKSFSKIIYLRSAEKDFSLFESKELKVYLIDNEININKNNDKSFLISINLKPKVIEKLKSKQKEEFINIDNFVLQNNDYKLIVTNLSGDYNSNKDSLKISHLEANLFLK